MSLKFTIIRDEFLDGLSSFQNITNKKGVLAILSNVLIETSGENEVILTATDLEVGLRLSFPAQVISEGSITLPCKKVFEIVRESGSKQISIEEKENSWVVINAGFSTYNLAGIPNVEFPEFPTYDIENFVEIESYIFLELIEKIIYSIASEQENIYSLTSVLFERVLDDDNKLLRMVSSDGHRLSIMDKIVSADIEGLMLKDVTLIPKKGIQEWKKFCESRDLIEISLEESQVVLRDKKAVMVIRLKNGEFPKYSAIIDSIQQTNSFKIKRIPFLESLKRINIFTEDIFHTIQLNIDKGKIILSSQNADLGNAKDEIDVEYYGETLVLGFNCRYFIETLQVMNGEYVEAYVNSNNSPCLLKSDEDEGFTSIIMPMQL